MDEKDFIEFAKILGKLKRTPRTGWKIRDVKDCESVAEHVFRVVSLAMLISDVRKMNTEKIMRMCIMHDWEEAVTGDIRTPEKIEMGDRASKMGLEGFRKVVERLPEGLRKEYLELWKEYERQETAEAKFIYNIDKIEMMIQVLEYEKEQAEMKEKFDIFWKRYESLVKDPFMKKVFEKLKEMRQ